MNRYQCISAISRYIVAIFTGSCKTKFETTKSNYKASRSELAVDHGEVLTYSICGGCHYDHSAHKFIGTQIHEVPGIVGKVYSANLTHSQSHGITPVILMPN